MDLASLPMWMVVGITPTGLSFRSRWPIYPLAGMAGQGLASRPPYLVIPTFMDAGIGEQGRSVDVVTKEFGSNFRPGAVATDMPLEIERHVDFGLQNFCEKCLVCAETCPPGAISREVIRGVRRWHFDNNRCRRFWDSIGGSCGIC